MLRNMRRVYRLSYSMQLPKSIRRRLVLTLFCILVFWLFLKWKMLCTNSESHQHIHDVCTQYSSGLSVGNLCYDLCQPHSVSSLSCLISNQDKEAVFSGVLGNNSVEFISIKKMSTSPGSSLWLDTSSKVHSSEEEYAHMLRALVKLKFNISISNIDAKKILYVQYHKWPIRYIEMEHIWPLMQDNEYLALSLYNSFEIFPKLLGSCGSVYAVQKLPSISGYWHLMTLYESKEEWKKRIDIAIMILDLLVRLENSLPEPLLICNVKMNHFGLANDFKKVLYLNVESVYPLSVARRIAGNGSQCRQHSECDFFNCRSFCNLITFKCQYGVVNNNLQMVCEKIFLGWVMSGRAMIPGLLLGPWTPRILIELLELCANPDSETGTPRASAVKEIHKRLHTLLKHLK